MRTRSKLLLTVVGALVALSMSVSGASANSLRISDQDFLAEWESLTFGESIQIACPVTIKGSFHRETIAKSLGALLGYVTEAIVAERECESSAGSGEATVLQDSLPWHITYGGFIGTLPALEGVNLNLHDTAFEIFNLPFGISCLYQSGGSSEPETAARGIVNVESGGVATNLVAETGAEIPLNSGGFLCPGTGHFDGPASIKTPGDEDITVTLI